MKTGTIHIKDGIAILGTGYLVLSVALGENVKVQVLATFASDGESVVAVEIFDAKMTDTGGIIVGGVMSETAKKMDLMDLSWMTDELQKYADDMGIEYTVTGNEPMIQ